MTPSSDACVQRVERFAKMNESPRLVIWVEAPAELGENSRPRIFLTT